MLNLESWSDVEFHGPPGTSTGGPAGLCCCFPRPFQSATIEELSSAIHLLHLVTILSHLIKFNHCLESVPTGCIGSLHITAPWMILKGRGLHEEWNGWEQCWFGDQWSRYIMVTFGLLQPATTRHRLWCSTHWSHLSDMFWDVPSVSFSSCLPIWAWCSWCCEVVRAVVQVKNMYFHVFPTYFNEHRRPVRKWRALATAWGRLRRRLRCRLRCKLRRRLHQAPEAWAKQPSNEKYRKI